MVIVYINEPKFEYDIMSLVKAFYPEHNVRVGIEKIDTAEETIVFYVKYEPTRFSFYDSDNKLLEAMEVPINSDRASEKNIIKKLIYIALSRLTGTKLAWGDLTGIRPTKIPRKMLEEGKTYEEVMDYMKDTYLISDEKARLSIDIAAREIEILKPLHYENGYSVYIGIPFCPTTCLYCSFTSNSISMWKEQVDAYLTALEKEIDYVGRARLGKPIDSIYIGGGTPTTLSASELERLLSYIEAHLDIKNVLEYTVEAGRPDSITEDKLKVLLSHKVTRISVNPQTMNQETLDLIGRRHTVEDVERAFYMARDLGFNNINMDIILGLPNEGPTEVSRTIDRIVKLSPDSLTVHSLAIKRASRLSEWINENGYKTMINTPRTMEIAYEGAMALNMKPYYLYRQKNMAGNYENTGYAKDGAFGIYNILIMEELEPIVALGPGSVSKVITRAGEFVRNDNVKDVKLYIDNIEEMINRKRELFSLE